MPRSLLNAQKFLRDSKKEKTRSQAKQENYVSAQHLSSASVSQSVTQNAINAPTLSLQDPKEPLPPCTSTPPLSEPEEPLSEFEEPLSEFEEPLSESEEPLPLYTTTASPDEFEDPPPFYSYPIPKAFYGWPSTAERLLSILRCDRSSVNRLRHFLTFQLQMDYEVRGPNNAMPTLSAADEAHFLDLHRRLIQLRDSVPFVQHHGHLCEYLDPYLKRHLYLPATALGLADYTVAIRILRFGRYHRARGDAAGSEAESTFENSVYVSGTMKIVTTFDLKMLSAKFFGDKYVIRQAVPWGLATKLRSKMREDEKLWFADLDRFLWARTHAISGQGVSLSALEESCLSTQGKQYWALHHREIIVKLRSQPRCRDLWMW